MGFETIDDVASYLKLQCRTRKLMDGKISFEPKIGQPDRTSDVATFFRDNPQYEISPPSGRFMPFSVRAIERLNAQSSDALKIDSANCDINLADKYR